MFQILFIILTAIYNYIKMKTGLYEVVGTLWLKGQVGPMIEPSHYPARAKKLNMKTVRNFSGKLKNDLLLKDGKGWYE